MELPAAIDAGNLFEQALAEGVVFMPGQVYSRGARYRHCLRLSCCQELDARFVGAIATVGRLANALQARAAG